MKAIIMAGGKGTRLMPISELVPKPMTRLLGVPLLEHLVLLLKQNGFTELCLALGHKPECITEYFGDGSRWGVSIRYHIEDEPLGTAGGVKACEDFYGEESFLVISGDSACDFRLKTLFDSHLELKSDVTMALFSHPQPLRYGTVVTDKHGHVISFIEKPDWSRVVTDLVNTGVYIISPKIMELVPSGKPYDFARDLFPLLAQRGCAMNGLPMEGYWCDIGDSESYLRCSMDALKGRLKVKTAAGNHVFAGEGVFQLDNDVTVVAPSVICRGVSIGAGTVIEHSILHPNSRVGENCRLRGSVIDGGFVGDYCIINETVVCRGAGVFPQTVTAKGAVIPRPGVKSPPPLSWPEPERRRDKGLCRELSCTGRAELMRLMSGALWEAGADFSDGIMIKDGKCKVRIYPLAEESAISVEAVGGRERDRLAACDKYSALAESFGGVAKI